MNEAETRAELIDSTLKAPIVGLIRDSGIRREMMAPDRPIGHGKRAQPKRADYVLEYRHQKPAVMDLMR
ncbi:hypothetical protein [Laspinema olomoucense]|uniref:hypothetical protein n=1 Tax=Laspinema olomoucense TaxID=3231600 RepID=UPI0021BA5E78|nr:hypothetical protein [Laspinema sp. D3d]MCT7971721.1 hypothetical protein [Laspinema sp. D3d]